MRTFRLAIAALLVASCAAPTLVGTQITPTAAPDFTLTDGISGKPITLSAQRGKIVVLAFLYTHCPDVCPLTAERFRMAQQKLSDGELFYIIQNGIRMTGMPAWGGPDHGTEDSWKLVFNSQHGQPGTQHNSNLDIAAVAMKISRAADPPDEVTISLTKTKAGGMIAIEWGDLRLFTSFY